MPLNKNDAMRRVQSLIKGWMVELECLEGWKSLHPHMINSIRRVVVRIAWSAYKIGVVTEDSPEE